MRTLTHHFVSFELYEAFFAGICLLPQVSVSSMRPLRDPTTENKKILIIELIEIPKLYFGSNKRH